MAFGQSVRYATEMSDSIVPAPHSLAKKPLAEAIFELRWALRPGDFPGIQDDPGFRILVGRYYDKIRNDYGTTVDLPAARVPESMTPHAVRHQFRAGQNQWPLTQIGPGVVTFNETKAYTWEGFSTNVSKIVNALFTAYPTDIVPLIPIQIMLRYVNTVLYNPLEADKPLLQFLGDNLHTSLVMEPLLFDEPDQANSPSNIMLTLSYKLDTIQGSGSLLFVNGEQEGKPAIVWEINIMTKEGNTPKIPEDINAWIVKAHAIAENWFFTLCRGDLLGRFEGSDEK
jgi:uncharacterized protein (TIGR04255 family)